MTTLSSHVSPYAGPPERLPADPPRPFPCDLCGEETYCTVGDGEDWGEGPEFSYRCVACKTWGAADAG